MLDDQLINRQAMIPAIKESDIKKYGRYSVTISRIDSIAPLRLKLQN